MNLWKISTALVVGTVLMSCSKEKDDDDVGIDCSAAPKLTKTCLEGTWEVSEDYEIQIAALKDLDTGNVDASSLAAQTYGDRYVLKFHVSEASRNKPATSDSLTYLLYSGEDCDPCTSGGSYTLSADSSSISINLSGVELNDIAGNYKTEIYGDSLGHILSWPSSTKPIFSLASTAGKTAEVFYRSIPK